MRRLLVTVDAGERECGACRHVIVGKHEARCELWQSHGLRFVRPHVALRLLECLAAEDAATRKEAQ